MKMVWLSEAIDDLKALRHYIAQDNPKAAQQVAQAILKGVNRLATHPDMGRPGRVVGTRELMIVGTPYLVPYRVAKSRVEILRVFHGVMNWATDE